jgi:hypothetical protein
MEVDFIEGHDSAKSFDSDGFSCVDMYAVIEKTAKPQRERSAAEILNVKGLLPRSRQQRKRLTKLGRFAQH